MLDSIAYWFGFVVLLTGGGLLGLGIVFLCFSWALFYFQELCDGWKKLKKARWENDKNKI